MPLNGFGIFLENYTTMEKIELPVNPAEFKLKYQTEDTSQTIINLGEINQIGKLKLTGLEIESAFPKYATHYLATDNLKDPDEYIDFLKNAQKRQHLVQVVIASTNVSLTMTVASFEYGMTGGYDDEYIYTLGLKEWREYGYKKNKKKKGSKSKTSKKKRTAPAGKISTGSIVRVTGRLHRDSYGAGAGMSVKNQKLKVTIIASGRDYPIHVSTMDGTPQGWVKRSEVSRV